NDYSSGRDARPQGRSGPQDVDDALDFLAQVAEVAGLRLARARRRARGIGRRLLETVARAADRESLLVEQLSDAADEQHLVVLVVAAVAAALDGLELRELLLPVAQHVRLHAAQLAHLPDREVALRGDRRQDILTVAVARLGFHGSARRAPSASGS